MQLKIGTTISSTHNSYVVNSKGEIVKHNIE